MANDRITTRTQKLNKSKTKSPPDVGDFLYSYF